MDRSLFKQILPSPPRKCIFVIAYMSLHFTNLLRFLISGKLQHGSVQEKFPYDILIVPIFRSFFVKFDKVSKMHPFM